MIHAVVPLRKQEKCGDAVQILAMLRRWSKTIAGSETRTMGLVPQ
jgi:hypothetical protein